MYLMIIFESIFPSPWATGFVIVGKHACAPYRHGPSFVGTGWNREMKEKGKKVM